MTEYLETTVDKFIFKVATDCFYNDEGVWAKAQGDRVRIGLSDFLQQRSGDVAFAEVKPEGTQLEFGDEVAVIGYGFDSFWARLAKVKIVAE